MIYCGINDILEERPSKNFLDNLGSLISDLKEKNSDMKIYACQVVPPAMLHQCKAEIDAYNDHLLKWSESNGIKVITTPAHFMLRTVMKRK